ncbi:tRNA (adenosine(37)-N6)-threonylcarbamoyltransferase complex ATPase subunit type 1 TsaE [Marinimicrobium locisalis]|uniref:tRNA (adenosine(37)-N6)-threonylcarbamoyltransferase complex ATPase subunit type 1 TsaE n=1 Tax=Marinimicrobium locisalis TaxID=546022 RepID=UPI003221A7D4
MIAESGLSAFLSNEADTLALGESLGRSLSGAGEGLVLFLEGDLGAGKTTFCRGLLRGAGHSGAVKSPTYTLVEPYELGRLTVNHFDLYRLGDPEELEYMGIRDYFRPSDVCIIEWPERGQGVLPAPDLRLRLTAEASGRRAILTAGTSKGARQLNLLALPDSLETRFLAPSADGHWQ